MRSKSPVVMSPMGTLMRMSRSVSVASCAFSLTSNITSMLRDRSCCACTSFSRVGAGSTRFTTITMSAQVLRATSIGNVPHHAAVGKDPGIEHDRRERARDRHARAHGGRDVAVIEHHHVARHHVGRDGAERDGQLVEVGHRARARHVAAQQVVDRARVGEPARSDDLAVDQAHLDLGAGVDREAFLLDGFERAAADAADDGGPVDTRHELLDFRRGLPGRVTRAHEGADARAGDAVDRDVQLLEHLERADVRATLGAAAGEHEADARPSLGAASASAARRDARTTPPEGGRGARSRGTFDVMFSPVLASGPARRRARCPPANLQSRSASRGRAGKRLPPPAASP